MRTEAQAFGLLNWRMGKVIWNRLEADTFPSPGYLHPSPPRRNCVCTPNTSSLVVLLLTCLTLFLFLSSASNAVTVDVVCRSPAPKNLKAFRPRSEHRAQTAAAAANTIGYSTPAFARELSATSRLTRTSYTSLVLLTTAFPGLLRGRTQVLFAQLHHHQA